MKHWKLAGSTAAIALFAGSGAFAEITPEEVWQNWQDLSASYGQTVTAESAERDGDTLVVTGLSMAMEQDGMSMEGWIDEVSFTDLGDGTVEITMSDTYSITMTAAAIEGVEGSTASEMAITITQADMSTIASGTAAETSYEIDAPLLAVTFSGGKEGADADGSATATLTGMTASYTVAGAEGAKTLDSEFAAASLALVMDVNDPTTATVVKVSATIADLAGASTGTYLGMEAMADMAAALKAGFTTEATFTFGATSFAFDVTEAGSPTRIAGTMTGGDFAVAVGAAEFLYGTSTKGVNLTISSAEIPFPELKLSYAEAAFKLAMPLMKTDAPANFAFLTKLVDLSVSKEIWDMIDPTAALPHDPATVIIDTKGTATLTSDLVDPAQMAMLGEGAPGVINSLELTELRATIAGAELTGTGSFTFDNSDMTTFDGVPAPTGKIDLKLVGANTLADKLVGMGLLTEDMANQGRMMASMFANTSDSVDEMTSTLEFKDKGFFANGMQMK